MKSVLITGAARGFGRELVKVYVEKGWRVFPLIRKESDAARLVSDHPEDFHPIVGDVSLDSVTGGIAEVLERCTDSLDLLINNAGIIRKNRGLLKTNPEELIEHYNVHCAGAYRCTVAALPFLRKAKSAVIVNISSRWGSISRTVAGQGGLIYSYQMAKCAQNMFSACLHQELTADGIRVFAVHPGRLKTSVAAADADTDPREAAVKLAGWIERAGNIGEFGFHDIINDGMIGW